MREILKKTDKRIDFIQRSALMSLYGQTVKDSPVYNGEDKPGGGFRANWQLSATLNSDYNPNDLGAPNVEEEVRAAKFGTVVYLFNNTPYGDVLEYGKFPEVWAEQGLNITPPTQRVTADGYSTQAPHGVVRIQELRWDGWVRASLAAARRQYP